MSERAPQSMQRTQPIRDADGTDDCGIASWSAHHCPPGTPVRYVLCHDDAESPVRLVFGPSDQVQLDLSLTVANLMIANLTRAIDEISERSASDGTGTGPTANGD